jgi:hypothetical protein
MTLESQAQLTFNLLATSVAVGSDVVLTIDLNAVTDLYGYQFEVNYDAARLSVAESKFVDSFFDTGGNASIVPSWNASCSAGVCRFAVTKVQPGAPVSGSGALAQIKFTGVAPGVAMLTISNDILSDRDANQIQHSATTGYLTVYGWATVSGVVKLQGRSTPIDSGTVTLYDQNGLFGPTAVSFDAVTGAWSASVPVFGSTTYDIVASHTLYLSNRLDGVSVTAGGSFAQTTTTLRGGDANNDGQIELGDLTCVGGAFGGPPSACGSTGSTDINHDGIVNILDLVLPGGNYGLTSPQTW